MRRLIRVAAAAAAIAGVRPATGFAQSTQVALAAPAPAADRAPAAAPMAGQPAPTAPEAPAPWRRWLDVQSAVLDARYRFIESSEGVTTSNHLQHRQTLKAGVKLDAAGRYSVQALIGTGTSFTASWENSGVGTGDADWNPAVRHFYVAGKPAKGLELQVGGLAMARGESSEITSYDNDGFMVGERVSVQRRAQLYFDEIAVTVGYLGDTGIPNVFRRLDSLNDHNYTQLLVARQLHARVTASADWTKVAGIETWRQAARITTREARLFDSVRVELYERVDGVGGKGFAAGFEKALPRKSSLTLGWADIDRANPTLNGDRYARGRRIFADARIPLPADFSLNAFYTRAIDDDVALPLRTRFDVVVTYNVLKGLQRAAH